MSLPQPHGCRSRPLTARLHSSTTVEGGLCGAQGGGPAHWSGPLWSPSATETPSARKPRRANSLILSLTTVLTSSRFTFAFLSTTCRAARPRARRPGQLPARGARALAAHGRPRSCCKSDARTGDSAWGAGRSLRRRATVGGRTGEQARALAAHRPQLPASVGAAHAP